MIAVSGHAAVVAPPILVTRFGNATVLTERAGMPPEDIHKTRSNTLAAYYEVEHPPLRDHDDLNDAMAVAYVMQDMLRQGLLTPEDFA